MELGPSQPQLYAGLMLDYLAWNCLAEVQAAYHEAQARHVDLAEPDRSRYLLEGDKQTMTNAAASVAGKPDYPNGVLVEEAFAEAYFGRRAHALELFQRAEEEAVTNGDRAIVAAIESYAAMLEALFGNPAEAASRATSAFELSAGAPRISGADSRVQPHVALAFAGDPALAAKKADRLASQVVPGGIASSVWLWELQAVVEMKHGNPLRALDLLMPVKPDEWAAPTTSWRPICEAWLTWRPTMPRKPRWNSRPSSTLAASS
jgi:hypothetical protein